MVVTRVAVSESLLRGAIERSGRSNVIKQKFRELDKCLSGKKQPTPRAAKAEFADTKNADAWVVAYVLVNGCVVVTMEKLAPDAKARIPLPNVCQALSVPYIDTFQMLRELGVRLG